MERQSTEFTEEVILLKHLVHFFHSPCVHVWQYLLRINPFGADSRYFFIIEDRSRS